MTHPTRDLDPARSARDLYGVELRRQRQLTGLSLDRLSDIVNYSKTHLHGVETGERLPLPRSRRSWTRRSARGSCSRGCGGR
ncbi:helix-turn-helix domain-containing protein [Streptomyces broussonetiae]|uniref:Helix-turn-helix transcriptional regulator n=1 Tax=Streptomyces broussonetiae TaxID=2686304 RepID=A0ABV5E6S4_9ACTN